MRRAGYVYILASKKNGTLYVGVTSDLSKRIWEHKNNIADGFTKRYHVHMLVYYEVFEDMYTAISREKSLKGWGRIQKKELIERMNPNWQDLHQSICG